MPKFLVLGLGVDAVHHATVEVLQALGTCGRAVFIGMDKKQQDFLSRFCAEDALKTFAAAGEKDAEKLILKELAAGKDVCLATPGHPFYWSGLAGRIIAKSEAKGFSWQTFGSISPMGLAISAAGITLGTDVFGLQSFDTAVLAENQAVLNSEWPLTLHFYAPLDKKAFARAADFLAGHYPEAHPVLWCYADRSEPSTLKELKSSFAKISSSTVLYLPETAGPASKIGRGDDFGRALRGVSSPAWVKE